MPVERREQAIAIWIGSTGNGRSLMFNGRRQPSRGGTSRMTRECQVRICEGLEVKFLGPTRHVWTAPAVQEESDYQRSVRVQSCIRPLKAAVLTAGPDVIR